MAIFNCAHWKPVGNHSGQMTRNIGLLLHHAVGNGSLYNFFNNPSSQVSAHFWVSKTGIIEQYVDSNVVAWHAMQMNDTYCGVETEGCVSSDEPMTTQMIDALATLYKEGNTRHGWPNELANSDGETGFGFHRMGVATACPCDVRLSKRSEILAKAFGANTTPPPTSTTAPALHVDYFGMGHNDTHPDVRTWQNQMSLRGWTLAVDQMYGPESANVCKQFQAEKGLTVDGLVGPITWKASWEMPIT